MSATNGVMMQCFQWYTTADGKLWNELARSAHDLASTGFTSVWLPPTGKGSGGAIDVGYGIYDLFDLGEFNQKKTVRTKYGTKKQLLRAIKLLQRKGIQCYIDVVFNHKDGADEKEDVWVQEVSWYDRNEILSDWQQISAWTKFTFPGRHDQYSSMKWNFLCFDALSYNALTQNADRLYRIKDKTFETEVSHEHGNYDYLLANDLDTDNQAVRDELFKWGEWILDTTSADGFRIDAVKHIDADFFLKWLSTMRDIFPQKELFSVGEYWSTNVNELHGYIAETNGVMSLFDVPLHNRFCQAGNSGNRYDLRTIFDHTLVREQPTKAVTFVENHDTQPCQSLESTVEPWFKPLAYALILLRGEGYPCVFYGDYYGATYPNCRGDVPVVLYSHRWMIDKFMEARKNYGFGDQHDYFDHPNTIAWMRTGDADHPAAMAIILSNGSDGYKWMNMYRANKSFHDITEHIPQKVTTNSDGWGQFFCPGGKVSVWVQE